MKKVFYFVIAIIIVSMTVCCSAFRKVALRSEDYGRQVHGSMEPIDFGEKYPSVPLQPIPPRFDLIKGELDNGLTYYILSDPFEEETAYEPGKACFRLVQNTGSLVEDDHKTGVAHFVEHYAFNGTEHFPDLSAIDFMRRIGINYGDDGNAVTTFDYTEYMLDNVPVDKNKSNIDSCLLLLRDWACALTFDPKHLEIERSVVLEEYRATVTSGQELVNALLEGTRYGERSPIGEYDDIKNLTIDDLKDYYQKWYQPQNQAVVVFGDVIPWEIELKIKDLFGSIPRGKTQLPDYKYTPLSHSKPKTCVVADNSSNSATFYICFSSADDSLARHRNTTAWYIGSQVRKKVFTLLKERLERIQNETMLIDNVEENSEATMLNIRDDYPVFFAFDVPKDNWRQSFGLVAAEIEKIKRYGWTKYESEIYFRKGNDIMSYNIADSIYFGIDEKTELNTDMLETQSLSLNFVYGTPIFDSYNFGFMDHKRWHGTSPSMAHDYFCKVANDSNTVIMLSLPDSTCLPTEDDVLDAYLNVRNTDLSPSKYQYAEGQSFYDLIDALPDIQTPGKVVTVQKSDLKYCTELTLSNGVKVIVTNVGSKSDYLKIKVLRFGELLYYADEDVKKISLLPSLVASKFSPMSYNQNNMLSSLEIDYHYDEFEFDSQGLMSAESVLKYVRYALTDNSLDSVRLANYKLFLLSTAETEDNPLEDMDYQWNQAVYGEQMNNRYGKMTKQEVEQLTFNELQALYKSYTSNYDGAVIVIQTEYPVKVIQPLIEKYLGSLPSLPQNSRQRKAEPFKMVYSNDSLHLKSPVRQSRADVAFGYVLDYDAPYSQEHDIVCDAFQTILTQSLYDQISIDDGIVYDITAQCELATYDNPSEYVRIEATCAPNNAATVMQKADYIIRQMAYGDLVSEKMLREYVNGKIINLPRKIDDKEYFDVVCNYYQNHCTDRRITDEKLLRALTIDKVKALAREFLEKGYKKQVVVSSEI